MYYIDNFILLMYFILIELKINFYHLAAAVVRLHRLELFIQLQISIISYNLTITITCTTTTASITII